jgi:HtrA serine peptidase 2
MDSGRNNSIFGATSASSGSGFIISKDGFIVTNAHVLDKTSSNKVLVTMWNSKKRYGVIHSMDKSSDIALIKLIDVESDEDLPIAKLGVNNRPRVGEFVVALGSPLHLANSVTFGIISSTARHASELGMIKNRNEFIQTDAAINEGNSGGPLVNLNGEVIGINSMKIQGSSGISFAIPIDTAYQIIRQLQTNKKVIRPYLGMKMANYIFNQNGGQRLRNKQNQNNILSTENIFVIVVDVEKGSPSEKAGFQNGDIILEVDGQSTNGMRSIYDAIGLQVGKTITFLVQRSNKYDPITINVTTESEKKT